ncbi:NUDIX domain-containing protein [Chitinophaga horti]|uniref:NUDIX domain-containing protein n=1 Tax=Chitinophaga horti TaxID=2920382 RepID=A0ABY6J3U2_9BACT|nr:NUDIX domain-containing protein [Chitinophaga horti]UYQ94258.1 NUDIX domain-containing protein [Chitinophaga horti]
MQTPIVIYINERSLHIVSPDTNIPGDLPSFSEPNDAAIADVLEKMERDALPGAILRTADPASLFNQVKAKYTVLEAGGGLVTNPAGDVLMIFRRNKWDLPKGKWDDGETIEECALREVREETGLHSVTLGDKITETFHYYSHKGKRVLKHSHWYAMHFTGTELTVPQIEEDIMDIEWVKQENVDKYLKFSYQNIINVFEAWRAKR